MKMEYLKQYNNDCIRYHGTRMPAFQKYFRKTQCARNKFSRIYYRIIFSFLKKINHIDLFWNTQIGGGLYIGHPYCITINPNSIIGCNVNIHKGVTIGQENRGKRKGSPIIGNNVWIGINSTIVGKIIIGDDVLIAPNTFVNCDVPSHSVVYGNPCIIKQKDEATKYYINSTIS